MKALYRIYRPCRLEDVLGQEQVTAPLAKMLKSGKFSHAFLFTGPRGCGKTSVARIFAHAINNFNYELEDDYVDIVEIDAASNTGVDSIRELREKATVVPSVGNYKVYIIDEVHMLSRSAFNALLKTLEEPPAHVVFIMATTDPEKIPATILSRTQTYKFKLVDPALMLAHLEKIAKKEGIKIDRSALEVIVRRGGGSFRDSLSLLDQISALTPSASAISATDVNAALGLPSDAIIDGIFTAYANSDLAKISDFLKTFYNGGGAATSLAASLITRILENPDPALYPLLAKLPDVKEPFADARLLLCFMDVPAKAAAPVTVPTAPTPVPETPKDSAPTAKTTAPKAKTTTAEPAAKPTPFDFTHFLSTLATTSSKLHSLLQSAEHDFDGSTLTIYPSNNFAKKSLEKPDSLQALASIAPDISIKISDKKPSAFSQISDIMGTVQEVNDGGIPF